MNVWCLCSKSHRFKKIVNITYRFQLLFTISGKPCPPYKIVILDEADSMTHDAQVSVNQIGGQKGGKGFFTPLVVIQESCTNLLHHYVVVQGDLPRSVVMCCIVRLRWLER